MDQEKIDEKIELLENEIKQLDTMIPGYIKSSNIFAFVAKVGIVFSGILFVFMQTVNEHRAFLTLLVLTIAAFAASSSDRNMAKRQKGKRDTLYEEYCELEKMKKFDTK